MEFPEIPGYRITRQLGKGGMAVVYLAVQANFERQVALKIMASHLLSDSSFGERFLREARIVAQLSHQHIVPVYDVGHYRDYHYMAMEYLPLGDLKSQLRKGLPLSDGLKIIKAIASGLDYAHRKNFIHRDIKPENILFREDGSPVISDFGIARHTESETKMTMTGTVIGSPHYMSPEQAEAGALDGRSDLYSLGIILYEMLTGAVPFRGESAVSIGIQHITAELPPLPPEMEEFQEFIDTALAKHRDDRFQTGEEFRKALEAIESTLSATGAGTVLMSSDDLRMGSSAGGSKGRASGASRNSRRPGASRSSRAPLMPPANPGMSKSALALAIAGVVSLGAVGAWYYTASQQPQPGAAQVAQQRSSLSEKNQGLLESSERAIDEERYFSPPGDNAQYYLTTLLALNPNSPEAQAAIVKLFKIYLNKTETAIASQNFDDANSFLNQSSQITFYIQDQLLLDQQRQLRTDVIAAQQQRIIADERRQEIKNLLAAASRAMVADRLTSPAGDNAYEYYQSIFELDSNNSEAQAGIKAIADRFLAKADKRVKEKNYAVARAMVAAATQVLPTHPSLAVAQAAIGDAEEADLAALKAAKQAEYETKLAEQEQERKQRAARIASLQKEIDAAIAAGRLTLPAGESAIDKIRELQKLDAGNAVAQKGVNRVVDKLTAVASAAIGSGALDEAERHLKIAQQLSPGNENVTSAQNELRAAKDRLAETAAVKQARQASIKKSLAEADRHLKADRPIAALESLGAALAVDPANQRALELRDTVLKSVYATVRTHIKKGQFDSAETLLNDLASNNAGVEQVNQLRASLVTEREKAAFAMTEEGQLAARAAELERKPRSAATNAQLRDLYRRLVAINPGQRSYSSGLNATSDYQLKLATAALQKRDFDSTQGHLAAVKAATPKHPGLARLEEELAITRRAQQQGSELLTTARQYIDTPYQKPGLFGNNDAARNTYRNGFQALSTARQVDQGHPQLEPVFRALEERYAGIIAIYVQDKDYKEAKKFIDDYQGYNWGSPSQRMQALLEEYATRISEAEPIAQNKESEEKKPQRRFIGGGF